MIALLENEFVSRKKWLEKEEFLDIIAIAESTPGPIAVNAATYIGYKMLGFWGSIVSTAGVCIPSFTIIYVISLFLDTFLTFTIVSYAFQGIQVCVIYLIFSAGIKLWKEMEKTLFNRMLLSAVIVTMIATTLLSIKFSAIYYILICGIIGVFAYWITFLLRKKEKDK